MNCRAQTIFANEELCIRLDFYFNKFLNTVTVIYTSSGITWLEETKLGHGESVVTRKIFVFGRVIFSTNTVLSTPPSPKIYHVTYQTSDRRYIDIAVVKSLLPSEGERVVVARRVAPGKNPFGAWDQSPFKRYAFERLINGPIVAPRQFQTCS